MKNNYRSVGILGSLFSGLKRVRLWFGGRWELWEVDSGFDGEKQWFPVTEPSVNGLRPRDDCLIMIYAEVNIKGEFG